MQIYLQGDSSEIPVRVLTGVLYLEFEYYESFTATVDFVADMTVKHLDNSSCEVSNLTWRRNEKLARLDGSNKSAASEDLSGDGEFIYSSVPSIERTAPETVTSSETDTLCT